MAGQIKKIVIVKLPYREALTKSAEQNFNAEQRKDPTINLSWAELPVKARNKYRKAVHRLFQKTGSNRLPTYPDNEWYHPIPLKLSPRVMIPFIDIDVAASYKVPIPHPLDFGDMNYRPEIRIPDMSRPKGPWRIINIKPRNPN